MTNIPIYSIVAYSGTGKTTLLVKLIAELKRRGVRVAAIKHDAHEFDIDHEGKDSWRFSRAGADVTVVASGTKAAMIENRAVPVEVLLERITDVDVILTEGYKTGPWPKIAVWRGGAENKSRVPVEPCIAVVTDLSDDTGVPCFGLDDAAGLCDFILDDMKTNKAAKSYK